MTDITATPSLDALFRPGSVAIVGASRDPESMSGVLLRNLQQSFQGSIYPVNPRAAQVGSLRAYPSIADVPESVDLAFIAVPSSVALRAAEQCVAKGVKMIIMITAGFSETGAEGKRLGDKLLQLVLENRVRLVGPNCMGVMNTDPANPLNGSFCPFATEAGNVAICTQSGALGFVFQDYIRQWSVKVSSFASIGNKLDLSENDLLRYWADDPATEVIQLYLESFRDPIEFRDLAKRISPRKPIVALKSGRTETGRRAAGSHTAALASRDIAVDALFRETGVIRANTLQELFETTAVLASQPMPRGRRVAVLSDAGGPGILCADALEANGLQVPMLSSKLQGAMRAFLRPETTVTNPIDLIGTTDPDVFRDCFRRLLASDEVDVVIVIYVARLAETTKSIAQAVRETAARFASEKVVLGVFMQSSGQPRELTSPDYRIPSFQYPESAARALAAVMGYAEQRERPAGRIPSFDDIRVTDARRVIERAGQRGDANMGWLDPTEVDEVLKAFGLPAPTTIFVRSEDDAVAAFEQIQAEAALKVVAPGAGHKTDVGGVVLDLHDEPSVRSAYHRVVNSVNSATGAVVQQMVAGGLEFMMGVVRDPQFGPQIALGAGGTMVEIFGDVTFRLGPLSDVDIEQMLQDTKAGRLLMKGFRGREGGDVLACKEVLARLSTLVETIPEIEEVDLNPVKILSPGRGACIVDARIRIAMG